MTAADPIGVRGYSLKELRPVLTRLAKRYRSNDSQMLRALVRLGAWSLGHHRDPSLAHVDDDTRAAVASVVRFALVSEAAPQVAISPAAWKHFQSQPQAQPKKRKVKVKKDGQQEAT